MELIKNDVDRRLLEQVIPPQVRKGDLRKLEIIQATVNVIATQGWQGLTFEAIGKASGISKSHVAYHFPKLEELIKATFRFVYATGQAIAVEFIKMEQDETKRLRAYVESVFYWLMRNPEHGSVYSFLSYMSTVNPEYVELQAELRKTGIDRVAAIVEGIFPAEIREAKANQLPFLASQIHALLVGNLYRHSFVGNSDEQKLLIKEETLRAMDHMLKL